MDRKDTKDAPTYFHPGYKEHYNSTTGPLEEVREKYIGPCGLAGWTGDVRILDVGFGLGYTVMEAIRFLRAETPVKQITVVSLEKDPGVFDLLLAVDIEHPWLGYFKRAVQAFKDGKASFEEEGVVIELHLGDGVQTIKKISPDFDAVFHDPFSPKKNPELWTQSFFSDVVGLMKDGAVLATYSCARSARDAMKGAGLSVFDGPVVGRRGPSTYAVKGKIDKSGSS